MNEKQTECFKWIIQKYPELAQVKTQGERSALHFAAIVGDTKTIEILVQQGMDSNERDVTGKLI